MKWIVITSDAVSSEKTVFSAYIAALLDRNEIKVNYIKLNPALSVNVGLLSPEEIGEVFITYDGGQVDKDVGIIERSVSYSLPAKSCLTLGQAVHEVNMTELNSKDCGYSFLSMDEHLTDYISNYIGSFSPTIVNIIEVGGSIYDIGTRLFCQTVEKMSKSSYICSIHIGENVINFKSLFGYEPTVFVDYQRHKESLLNRIMDDNVGISLNNLLSEYLNIKLVEFELEKTYLYQDARSPYKAKVRIAIVGRYIGNPSAYLSLLENVRHAAMKNQLSVDFHFVQSLYLNEANAQTNLSDAAGIIIPGGFGECGNEGMIAAARFARENDIPLIGICYGFEMMVIEFARNICGFEGANTEEIVADCPHPVICQLFDYSHTLTHESKYKQMNLGDCKILVKENTLASLAFDNNTKERNWNSYAINMKYWSVLEENGLVGSLWSEGNELVKGIELSDKKFYFGCQFHPEFSGNYNESHKIFLEFVKVAAAQNPLTSSSLKE